MRKRKAKHFKGKHIKQNKALKFVRKLSLVCMALFFIFSMTNGNMSAIFSDYIKNTLQMKASQMYFKAEIKNTSLDDENRILVPIYSSDEGAYCYLNNLITKNYEDVSKISNTQIRYNIIINEVENFGEQNEELKPYSNGNISVKTGDEEKVSATPGVPGEDTMVTSLVLSGNENRIMYENTHAVKLLFDNTVEEGDVLGKTYCITIKVTSPYERTIQFYFKIIDGTLVKFGRTDNLVDAFNNPIEKLRIWSNEVYTIYQSDEAKIRLEWDEGLSIDTTNNLVKNSLGKYKNSDSSDIKQAGNANSVTMLSKDQYNSLSAEDKEKSRYIYLNIEPKTDLSIIFYKGEGTITSKPIRAKVYMKTKINGQDEYKLYREFPLPAGYDPIYDFTNN